MGHISQITLLWLLKYIKQPTACNRLCSGQNDKKVKNLGFCIARTRYYIAQTSYAARLEHISNLRNIPLLYRRQSVIMRTFGRLPTSWSEHWSSVRGQMWLFVFYVMVSAAHVSHWPPLSTTGTRIGLVVVSLMTEVRTHGIIFLCRTS